MSPVKAPREVLDVASRRYTFPVGIDERGPIPRRSAYDPLKGIQRTGFTFTAGSFLHAVGCKTAALPSHERDRCLNGAYFMFCLLDFKADHLCFKKEIDSDLQTPRSQEVGIAMTCLFARRYWKIPWDKIESIRGRGKRFDYRGERAGLRAIFEAKGTKHRRNQHAQIGHGLEKKAAHHRRKEHADVELVLSTLIGGRGERPRVMLADPEFDVEEAFGEWADDYFRAKHYARVLQYIGAPATAYNLMRSVRLQLSKSFPQFASARGTRRSWWIREAMDEELATLTSFSTRRGSYLGRWIDRWVPPDSRRYGHLQEREGAIIEHPRVRMFQGLDEKIVKRLSVVNLDFEADRDDDDESEGEDGLFQSEFADGSIFGLGGVPPLEPDVQSRILPEVALADDARESLARELSRARSR